MLPKFRPRMWDPGPFGVDGQWLAVYINRKHGAGSEIDSDPDYFLRRHTGMAHDFTHNFIEPEKPIGRILLRPSFTQGQSFSGQNDVDDTVCVRTG